MRKKCSIFLVLLVLCLGLQAQEKGRLKGSIEFGPLLGPNLGFQISLEPKYNITDRSNLGLRIELPGLFGRDLTLNDRSLDFDNEGNIQGIFLPVTYEYYLGKRGKSFQPYIGGGLGYFRMNGDVTVFDPSAPENSMSATSRGTIGAITKFGFEWGKFRYGFAFTYVPDADLVSEAGQTIGFTRDYYVHFNMGLTLFGGKWKNQQ